MYLLGPVRGSASENHSGEQGVLQAEDSDETRQWSVEETQDEVVRWHREANSDV